MDKIMKNLSPIQQIAYAILCAKEVCKNPQWQAWADKWLDGTDRTEVTTREMAVVAWGETAKIAVHHVEWMAQWGAWAAAWAVDAAEIWNKPDVNMGGATKETWIVTCINNSLECSKSALGKEINFAAFAIKAMEIK